MTKQETIWFEALTKDRLDSASTLEKPSMRGVQRSVVDKYSDQAHFVYELLQNADDVKATEARFELKENGLVFKHNGTTHFTISDPATEDSDSGNGTLGHVNSITSIANSNKTQASIGKFGVGFKAVFQYTRTPHIYDPNFRFKLERFIVPRELKDNFSRREASETVFWFPFDHERKSKAESHSDISEKLKSLVFPVLFLSNLESVSFDAGGLTGQYSKKISKTQTAYGMTARLISLVSETNGRKNNQKLWLFTRECEEGGHPSYSIGFFLKNGDLTPVSHPAFCFFPTKEATNLNFILHGPFLLTDSREGIKAGEEWNRELIQKLAALAADSLLFLRDRKLVTDGIIGIIPYARLEFTDIADREKISFKPFYTAIEQKFQSEELLPATNAQYCLKRRAYWASNTKLVALFSDAQLSLLTGTPNAHWVFPSLGKEALNSNKALLDYIDGGSGHDWNYRPPNLIVQSLDPEALLKKISKDFIEAQPQKWLHSLYLYLAERQSYQKCVRPKPIFLDQDGNAVPAYDENDQLVLFLPDDDIDGYTTIKRQMLSNKATREFVETFGVKQPSLRDEIYNKILPAYDTSEGIDTTPHFQKFFRYFKECRNEDVPSFIGRIKGKAFLLCKSADDEKEFRGRASDIYMPTDDLKAWFANKPDTRFLQLDRYRELVGERDLDKLEDLLRQLGVRRFPAVHYRELDRGEAARIGAAGMIRGHSHKWTDKYIEGCAQRIAEIDARASLLMWRMLPELLPFLNGEHQWIYSYKPRNEIFTSSETKRLRTAKWILNKDGNFVSADDVTLQSLSEQYDHSSDRASGLIKYLQIRDEAQDSSHLNDDEKRQIEVGKMAEAAGLTPAEAKLALEEAARKKSTRTVPARIDANDGGANGGEKGAPPGEAGPDNTSALPSQPTAGLSKLEQDILARVQAHKIRRGEDGTANRVAPAHSEVDSSDQKEPAEIEDSDDYTPRPVDYGKTIERAKERNATEISGLEHKQELLDKANSLPKYSYGWFLALLELECMANDEKNADGKTISISFGRIEKDEQSPKSIVLKEPNRFIPQSIEEISGGRVDIDFADGAKKKLHIESFTAREFSLLGKLKSADELKGIDLSKILEARIKVQNPSFLLRSLLEGFRGLGLQETFDMKANLTPEIEFVFGPPGTGKTTHLAEKVLIPLMRGTGKTRVLVLTPTNKAADVLTTRIMETMGADTSYQKWLVRFGTCSDDRIEASGLWRDRSFNFGALNRSVTVTTIARFAYDGFAMEHGKLHELKWDAIVIDEASMIPLVNIVYPLYQRKPRKFIIAGDPFQIEPIVAVEIEGWKDANIYTLVGLDKPGSFTHPVTEPHNYAVTNLETQYRSIPAIGEVFSRFTYNGILKHHRPTEAQRPLKVDGMDVRPVNLIKFPVSRYESIYRAKRLASGTPYQTYSALFTFEFVRWLAGQIQKNHAGEPRFRIGIIAPYRAQANLLEKLNDSWAAKPDSVVIQVGTIHGFQGDECDIIIAVLNPPPTISKSPQMFLNKQNILNVAISRARDWLFIIMPDKQTENIHNLRKVATIERLVRSGGAFKEYDAHAVEKVIFDNDRYLEEKTFSTGHQMVNVYVKPERHYEVRSDDSAIDVQIHGKDLHY